MPEASADDRRAQKQSVLSKVNQVLVNAGLNDTVWSIRDCDSTLFVLMLKKLIGKVRAHTLARQIARAHPAFSRIYSHCLRLAPNTRAALRHCHLADVSGGAREEL